MQNSSGDSASPWYMPHLMLTWGIGFELASRVLPYNKSVLEKSVQKAFKCPYSILMSGISIKDVR